MGRTDAQHPPLSGNGVDDHGVVGDPIAPDAGDPLSLLRELPQTIVRYDRSGRITFVNERFLRRTERAVEEVLGCEPFGWAEGDPVADSEEYRRMLAETLATGEPRTMTRNRPEHDGSVSTFEVSFRPERGATGDVVGAWAVARDDTDLALARLEVAAREREFRTLAENLPDVVLRYDDDCRTVYVNRGVRGGPAPANRLGRRPTEYGDIDPAEAAAYEAVLRSVLATGEQATVERRIDAIDGDIRMHSVLVSAERDGDGRIVGAVAIGRDVTDLARAHEERAENEHRFRTLADNLPEVLVRYDRDGRAVYANRQFELQIGGPPLVGSMPEDQPSRSVPSNLYRDTLREVLRTGRQGRAELSTVGPDGDQRFQSVRIAPEFGADATVSGAIVIGHDVTDLVHARQEAAAREREFRTLAEHLPDVVRRYDLDLRATYANHTPQYARMPTPDEVVGYTPRESAPPGAPHIDEYEQLLRDVIETGTPTSMTMSFTDLDAEVRTFHIVMHAEREPDGRVVGAITIAREISHLLRAEREIAESERKFRSLAENAVDHIARWDTQARRTYVNPAMARHLGGGTELLGRVAGDAPRSFGGMHDAILGVIADRTPRTVEQRATGPDGTDSVWEVRLVPEFDADGELTSVLGIGRDVTEVVHQRDALEHAARTDALTGVASRVELYERVPAMLDRPPGPNGVAMLLIDLDGFKLINDQYGHRLGDRILRAAAERFRTCIGPDDILVRIGGDEFVVVLDRPDCVTDASLTAHSLRMQLAELSQAEGNLPLLDASVGIALSPHHGTDVDALLAHADLALYEAKRAGRGRAEFYRPELRSAMERRSSIEQALRDCLPDADMSLHLQPVCRLGAEPSVWGAEALLRWTHPQLGPVPPDEFIRIAEQTGQIVPIGRWVLRRAAEMAVHLNAGRDVPLRMSVNVSTRQFTHDDIGDAVRSAMDATGCDPRWIVVELTESLLLEDLPLVRRSLDALRAMGVALAIDDFGTGYSALHYLTRLSVDHMKIDKSFVRDADVDHQQQEIVRALMAMAHALGIEVVAEGIETPGQAALLERLGCGLGQGYLLARPMPLTDFERWLADAPTTLRTALPA